MNVKHSPGSKETVDKRSAKDERQIELITTHLNADFDALASMLAAKKLYPGAILSFPGSTERSIRDFFVQSAAYLYNFTRIRSVPIADIRRLILVDTRQPGRIGRFAEALQNPGIDVHIYDHHPSSAEDIKGTVEIIRPVGATVTILAGLLQEKGIEITPEEATIMALGIYEDTGSFTFTSTTAEDLKAASLLLEKGADLNIISDMLAQELTAEQVSMLNDLIQSASTYTIRGIDIVISKLTVNKYVGDLAVLVHKLMDMENLDVLFCLASMEDRIFIIARSRNPEVNVAAILADFGGGGHPTAASATVKELTILEAEEKLIGILHREISPQKTAQQIMSSPVIYVTPDLPMKQANEMLTRYNITVLPVIEDGKIAGLISRRVIEKAIFHGLEDLPVSEYMTTEFAVVGPEASFYEIQAIIIDHKQRFLPVVDAGRVMGVITRTDLLNILVADESRIPRHIIEEQEKGYYAREKNITSILRERLPAHIISLLETIGKIADEVNYNVYVVGGFVRDLLLRVHNLDIDLVIEGDGIQFAQRLAEHFSARVKSHKKFGTAVVIFPDGFKLDVATARLEYYEYPAAMPTVELSSIKLDLYRRDFTINTLAIRLNQPRFGTLVDFFGGQRDLKDRRIRVLHNLSFVEDPTRVFRAIRFEQRYGLEIGKHTANLIQNAVRMNLFDRLSGRRLMGELRLILSEENPLPAIKRLAEFDLLKFIHPAISHTGEMESLFNNLKAALSWYHLSFIDKPVGSWLAYLLVLVEYLSNGEFGALCDRLAVSPRHKSAWMQDRGLAKKSLAYLNHREHILPSEIYTLLRPLSAEFLLYMMAKAAKKTGQKAISLYITRLSSVKPQINGDDLIALGIEPGPQFKTILEAVLRAKLDGLVKTKSDELRFVRENYRKKE
ncbi:MAG: CBS domain-containing protein [Thermodesulfobacteriota bacterium]